VRRFVNMAKSGRMAANRRRYTRPLPKGGTRAAGKREVTYPRAIGKRRG